MSFFNLFVLYFLTQSDLYRKKKREKEMKRRARPPIFSLHKLQSCLEKRIRLVSALYNDPGQVEQSVGEMQCVPQLAWHVVLEMACVSVDSWMVPELVVSLLGNQQQQTHHLLTEARRIVECDRSLQAYTYYTRASLCSVIRLEASLLSLDLPRSLHLAPAPGMFSVQCPWDTRKACALMLHSLMRGDQLTATQSAFALVAAAHLYGERMSCDRSYDPQGHEYRPWIKGAVKGYGSMKVAATASYCVDALVYILCGHLLQQRLLPQFDYEPFKHLLEWARCCVEASKRAPGVSADCSPYAMAAAFINAVININNNPPGHGHNNRPTPLTPPPSAAVVLDQTEGFSPALYPHLDKLDPLDYVLARDVAFGNPYQQEHQQASIIDHSEWSALSWIAHRGSLVLGSNASFDKRIQLILVPAWIQAFARGDSN